MCKATMLEESEKIAGLFGAMGEWEITLKMYDFILAYKESDGTIWFAVYQNGKIMQRVNSKYVETVSYEKTEV